jgi:nucleotide-binding universal stress UspA family protein
MTLTAADLRHQTWEPVHGPRVVVGVDGSSGAAHALQAAARAAALLNVPLVAFTVWSTPALAGLDVDDELDADARRLQDDAVRAVFGNSEPPTLHRTVREGSPARVLIQESQGASLLVAGSRGSGGFTGLELGSVGIACAARAPCPVLLVKRAPREPDLEPVRPPRIVVGLDGSEPSIAALRVALRAVDSLRGELQVVTVWQGLHAGGTGYDEALAAAAASRQAAALDEVLGAGPAVPLRTVVRRGSPAGVLVDESAPADLLIIGSRAQGAVSGVLFGGVTMACALHAVSDVLIVHAPDVTEGFDLEGSGRGAG